MGEMNFVSRGGLRGCVEVMREWEGVLCFSIVVETSLTDKNKQMSSATIDRESSKASSVWEKKLFIYRPLSIYLSPLISSLILNRL